MRKRLFIAGVLGMLAVSIGASTKYATARRDTAVAARAGAVYTRTFNVAPPAVDPHLAHQASGSELPIVVDGSKTPERIPDWIAYRHFISKVSLPSDAPVDEQARRNIHLNEVGLSPRDRAALLREIRGTRQKLDDIAERRLQWQNDRSSHAEGQRLALRAEEKAVYDDTQQRIRGAMSFEGGTRLSEHINRMKTGIVIRGSLPQF